MFYNELKQTNDDLLKVVESCHKKSPYYDYTETFKDYIKQVEELHKRFPPGSATQTNNSNATNLMNNSSGGNNSITTNNFNSLNSSPSNLFNNISSNNNTSTNTVIAAPTLNNTFSSASFIQQQQQQTNNNQDGNNGQEQQGGEDADDDTQPPQPNVDKFEEPDALYQARCKLYERALGNPNVSSASHTLLGCGSLFIKPLDSPSKLHLVVRQDPDLRKILLNLVITKSTILRLMSKAIQLVVPEENGKTSCYVAKVKDDKISSEIYQKLRSVKDAE